MRTWLALQRQPPASLAAWPAPNCAWHPAPADPAGYPGVRLAQRWLHLRPYGDPLRTSTPQARLLAPGGAGIAYAVLGRCAVWLAAARPPRTPRAARRSSSAQVGTQQVGRWIRGGLRRQPVRTAGSGISHRHQLARATPPAGGVERRSTIVCTCCSQAACCQTVVRVFKAFGGGLRLRPAPGIASAPRCAGPAAPGGSSRCTCIPNPPMHVARDRAPARAFRPSKGQEAERRLRLRRQVRQQAIASAMLRWLMIRRPRARPTSRLKQPPRPWRGVFVEALHCTGRAAPLCRARPGLREHPDSRSGEGSWWTARHRRPGWCVAGGRRDSCRRR